MSEISAHEWSEMRMRQAEEDAIRRKKWPEGTGKELVFEPKLVRERLKYDRETHTVKVQTKLP